MSLNKNQFRPKIHNVGLRDFRCSNIPSTAIVYLCFIHYLLISVKIASINQKGGDKKTLHANILFATYYFSDAKCSVAEVRHYHSAWIGYIRFNINGQWILELTPFLSIRRGRAKKSIDVFALNFIHPVLLIASSMAKLSNYIFQTRHWKATYIFPLHIPARFYSLLGGYRTCTQNITSHHKEPKRQTFLYFTRVTRRVVPSWILLFAPLANISGGILFDQSSQLGRICWVNNRAESRITICMYIGRTRPAGEKIERARANS